jgi:hydrogenase expression/formation protein HypC
VESNGLPYFHGIQTLLLDQTPAVGDWVLVHIDTAIRAIDAEEARQIVDALAAVQAASHGDPFEHLLADLINREPELPEHLRGNDPDNAHQFVGSK